MKKVSLIVKTQEGYIQLDYENVDHMIITEGSALHMDLESEELYLQLVFYELGEKETATFDLSEIVHMMVY